MQRGDIWEHCNAAEFCKITDLGQGFFGHVELCEYTGNDPKILAICKDYKIAAQNNSNQIITRTCKVVALKKINVSVNNTLSDNELTQRKQGAISSFANEAKILNYLQRKNVTKPIKGMGVEDNTGNRYIVSEYISYSKFNYNALSLEDFIKYVSIHRSNSSIIKVLLNIIPTAIVECQDELHKSGVLHLDSALRNFMIDQPAIIQNTLEIRLKIIDFGTSRMMDNQGFSRNATNHLLVNKFFDSRHADRISLRKEGAFNTARNTTAYSRRFSINTDIFARKITMINMLALLADCKSNKDNFLVIAPSLNEWEALRDLNNHVKPNPTQFKVIKKLQASGILHADFSNLAKLLNTDYFERQARLLLTDEETLQYHILKLSFIIERMHETNPFKEILSIFLTSFSSYLAAMPDLNNGLSSVILDDKVAFYKALNQYQERIKLAELNIIPDEFIKCVLPKGDYDKNEIDFTEELKRQFNNADSIQPKLLKRFTFDTADTNNCLASTDLDTDTNDTFDSTEPSCPESVYFTNVSTISPTLISTPKIYEPGNTNRDFNYLDAFEQIRPKAYKFNKSSHSNKDDKIKGPLYYAFYTQKVLGINELNKRGFTTSIDLAINSFA